ncbi:MAG TPA: efflux RND transporter periplasmic adaptor subunit [Alphaproteobacteria bacterium]
MKRVYMAIGFTLLVGGAGLLWSGFGSEIARSNTAPSGRASPAVPVVTAAVVQKAMPFQIEAIGTVQTIASVTIRARVDTQIMKVMFAEGEAVKAGDVLFELDKRAVEAQLAQAQAQLARDRAQLANAKRDVERYSTLLLRDYASRAQTDTAKTNEQSLEATVKADEAVIDNLRVQISYYTITAPIGGRTGTVYLKEGSVVKGNDNATASQLVTINQIDPIYVAFSVPQQVLGELRDAQKAAPVPVDAVIPNTATKLQGQVAFIDNTIDVTSGTITAKANIPNPDEKLWPGQFVNAVATLRVDPDVLVVPAPAVQIGQDGTFVFVIKPDQTAEPRPVKVSRMVGPAAVIAEGLQAGEQIVVDGQLRLTRGTRVESRPMSGSPAVAGTPTSGG